ncbi:G1/S-specific cyclin pas1 [Psilocybe cubensis]|uniref:Uncharacterized protein n=2 Tax=Psilocybe cubensis TaxID=181762 RepID=A0A8H7Y7J0_PSICU|nr:G1/S-specific cyclin pas1 [Psilocybe cubensis]KAH9485177.1 G1/S-specific cyclin pas1 [Psilocybe cubensis]
MHTATQIIAQRAPPASRSTKAARWQPYLQSATTTTTTAQLPRSPTIHTPHASVSSPAPHPPIHLVSAESSRTRPSIPPTTAQTPKDSSQSASSSKQKFASSLIDQAVSTLSEIWRPQDIPSVFLPPAKAGGCSFPPSTHPRQSSKQLSSDLQSIASHTLSTQPHTSHPSVSGHNPSPTLALLASGTESDQILPLKSFVHEVLRRSRTSGNVLQTALCYLEAIRPKVPQILQEENIGIRSYYQPESCIQKATPEELAMDAELTALEDAGKINIINSFIDDSMQTVRVADSGPEDLAESCIYPEDSLSNVDVQVSTTPPSTPSLPSPLLCPRRAFLASLILASKFSQDKCYSNRAWAKLSGLPPREIGRCERALGQALQWRLWVGKCAFGESAVTTTSSRTVIRSHSEPSLMPASTSTPFLSQDESHVSQAISHTTKLSEKVSTTGRPQAGIRRCLSLPLESTLPKSSSVGSVLHSDSETYQQDQVMSRPSVSDHSVSSSPSPPTPTLTYSPLSTDSSGERTIQVTAMDDVYSSSSCSGSQPWVGLVVDTSCDNGNVSFGGGLCRLDGQDFARQLAMLQSQPTPVAVVETDVATYGANYMWSADSRYILEATEVH